MANLATFAELDKLADVLIESATKEQLAECCRLLAMNLAHHQGRHGEIPLDETLAMLDIETPNEEQVQLLTEGMINFVGMLGNVCSGLGENKH